MIKGVTYCNDSMTISANKCEISAFNVGKVNDFEISYPEHIDPSFTANNYEVLFKERGCGFWLWKPYIINLAINSLEDNDVLVYSDAGIEFVSNVSHIINRMDEDIFFFTNGHKQGEWCKADVLRTILPNSLIPGQWDHNEDWVESHKQVQASVIFFKVNQKTRDFVKEWLLWCQMPGFIDDSPSKLPNYPTFQEHRHDQAILTCLQIKYGYKLHWWPTQYSEHIRVSGDDYPVMFNHHRMRNNEYQTQPA